MDESDYELLVLSYVQAVNTLQGLHIYTFSPEPLMLEDTNMNIH